MESIMSANKHGHGPQGSRLQNWVEHELVHLSIHNQEGAIVTDIPDRNLSLRVPITAHVMLHRLAQKLGRSKTACAEEIIANAIQDVYRHFDLPDLHAEDLEGYVAQTDKVQTDKTA